VYKNLIFNAHLPESLKIVIVWSAVEERGVQQAAQKKSKVCTTTPQSTSMCCTTCRPTVKSTTDRSSGV